MYWSNLASANTKFQLTLPSLIVLYMPLPYAFSDASENMCSSTGLVQKELYHWSILTSLSSCMLCYQMFQRVGMSIGIGSSQSIFCFQSSCNNIWGIAKEIIPKGSNMLLVELVVPLFVLLSILGHLHSVPKNT